MTKPCEHCGTPTTSVVLHGSELWCWPCHNESKGAQGLAPNVIGDDIPGGIEIKNGICNPDGSPRTYYSKSEMRRAAYEAGLFQGFDTPKVNTRLKEAELARKEGYRPPR